MWLGLATFTEAYGSDSLVGLETFFNNFVKAKNSHKCLIHWTRINSDGKNFKGPKVVKKKKKNSKLERLKIYLTRKENE